MRHRNYWWEKLTAMELPHRLISETLIRWVKNILHYVYNIMIRYVIRIDLFTSASFETEFYDKKEDSDVNLNFKST